MQYVIGTDEAGYGPNLGPLLVAASVWELPDELAPEAMYEALAPTVSSVVVRGKKDAAAPIAIADSKLLYKPSGTRARLELGLLAILSTLGEECHTWRSLWETLSPDCLPWSAYERVDEPDEHRVPPWHATYDRALPIDVASDQVAESAERLRRVMADSGVRLLALRAKAVFPRRFNAMLDECESKGALLSNTTLGLAAELDAALPDGKRLILCDKHGGRNRYSELLETHFPDWLIEIRGEQRERSVYRFGPQERRYEARFQMKGDSLPAPALASMAAKYLREAAMDSFNAYWQERVSGLRPTAGYPQDAKRFMRETAEARAAMSLGDELIWRRK